MKILFVLESFTPDINVVVVRMQNIVNTFSCQKDIDIRVIVYNPLKNISSKDNTYKINDNVTIVRYETRILPKIFYVIDFINPFKLFSLIAILMKDSYHYKPDIIFTSVPNVPPTIAAYITSIFLKNKCVIDMRDNWINDDIWAYAVSYYPAFLRPFCMVLCKLFKQLYLRSCKNALLISTVYDSMIPSLKGITKSQVPIVHIPNGIDVTELETIKKRDCINTILNQYGFNPKTDKIIIYVGMIGTYYRPEILINPIKNLIDKGHDIKYLIVGDGNSLELIQNMITSKGLSKNVFAIGTKKHDEVIELLLSSNMAFYAIDNSFPNPEFALGTKVLEYIACKLPILSVAGRNSAVNALVSTHGIGIALNWNELDRLEASIESILYDSEYSQRISNYYPAFLKKYDRMVNSKELYDSIIKYC
ncbi:glycosyltransferase [Methanocella sp. MCL-LM]|uniref:glycosyltransferase n=1 Tax=Methanocella sp. MCL-LM TaxID=3412035 RepID=UPI003C764035